MGIYTVRRGFTIVELLIVIVIIGILAGITTVAYNGVTRMATEATVKSAVLQNVTVIESYAVANSTYPEECSEAGVEVNADSTLSCRIVPDRSGWCVSVRQGDVTFYASSTDSAIRAGTCDGYILVPGNELIGTDDFWVMKYEARNNNGAAVSQPTGTPWVQISQPNATSVSTAACDGCHLISEAEWMTLAGNLANVPSNWSGGSVGSGYIYSGHNDNAPSNALSASTDDDGYTGTGQSSGNQRRTLTLSNGEVVWDVAGNVWEWTSGTITGSQPGGSGYAYREWNSLGGVGSISPSPLPSSVLPAAAGWTTTNGIGSIYSSSSETQTRGFSRGGPWNDTTWVGIFAMAMNAPITTEGMRQGFRVAR